MQNAKVRMPDRAIRGIRHSAFFLRHFSMRLTKRQYQAAFKEPMKRIGPDEAPPFDFWPYFDEIPAADLKGHDFAEGHVGYVYRDSTGRFEHILINCEQKNLYLVLVLDLEKGAVRGHRLLDLNKEYGLGK